MPWLGVRDQSFKYSHYTFISKYAGTECFQCYFQIELEGIPTLQVAGKTDY